VIVGVLLLRHPGEGLLTLTLLLIVFFIVEGISKVIFSLSVRPFPNWGWVLASGIVGILLAFYLWAKSLLRNFRLKRREPAVGRGIGGVEGRRDGRQRYAIARFVVFSAFRTDFRCSLRRL
jgi:hypothetical protein